MPAETQLFLVEKMGLEDVLPFLKRPARHDEESKTRKNAEVSEREELATERIRSSLYKKVIQRYSDYINKNEEKTVPELKRMIDAKHPRVKQIKDIILLDLQHDDKQEDPFARAEKAYNFCTNLRPLHGVLGISFWLTFDDIVELGAADHFDKSIFLASLIKALQAGEAKVRLMELEGGLKHSVVVFKNEDVSLLLDPSQAHDFRAYEAPTDESLESFEFDGKKVKRTLFEFDEEDFTDFTQELRA
ncbi:MAG TPA: hypothetical protein VGQ00_00365 [Candidatus Norongarragalinales archaeon]|jgi:hypothetical protein|nr:hypothetical protein [Candidatus Norongarragalinales archaeon]